MRGFLGLAKYYKRFIKRYGVITRPLTDLLKKEGFAWSSKATEAFQSLKTALTTALVLTLHDFNQSFVVETNVCNMGIGVVFMQKRQPIAYLSKGLSSKHQVHSVYDKEMLALVMAINKWNQYLNIRQFVAKTDSKALMYFLEKKLHTRSQLKWIAKLIQFDFVIEYKKGKKTL